MRIFNKWRNKGVVLAPGASDRGVSADVLGDPDESVADVLGRNRTILVVDDDLTVLRAFELKLTAIGFRVLTAIDGAAAMTLVHEQAPDLIVLDMIFPPDDYCYGLQWDGFAIMQWLRRSKQTSSVPIIAMSVEGPETFQVRALAGGAVAFFQKPINQGEFLTTIRRALGAGTTVTAE